MSYNLLDTHTKNKWLKIGTQKRSGVVIPLFSIHSKHSIGTGEIPDLKYIIDWCKQTGMSIIQLLPLNELGPDHAPYNAISTFALEPMYLRIDELKGIGIKKFSKSIFTLRKKYKIKSSRIDYMVISEKLKVLRLIFKNSDINSNTEYKAFIRQNSYWLKDYALFKILAEQEKTTEWEKWKHTQHTTNELDKIFYSQVKEVSFYYWLQWQLYEQLKEIKKYANDKGVLLMGDLPFLVSRSSADVWKHKEYFKLNLSAGAPPDMYHSLGQLWGMPPYNWDNIEKDGYAYIKHRLKYAENFYDMFRMDHIIGLFRVWTVALSNGVETGALHGRFDPENENLWEEHGEKILDKILSFTDMLPCGEDLGTVPACSYTTLRDYGIPGVDFQRFLKDDKNNFISPDKYRTNSAAVISTHDSTFFTNWWKYEAGTVDGKLFDRLCNEKNIKGSKLRKLKQRLFSRTYSSSKRLSWKKSVRNVSALLKIIGLTAESAHEIISIYKSSYDEKKRFLKYLSVGTHLEISAASSLVKKCIERINSTESIFSIQLIHEYLFLESKLFNKMNKWNYRINTPGTHCNKNWNIRLPISVDKLNDMKINSFLLKLNTRYKRKV